MPEPDLPALRLPSPERRETVVQTLSSHFAAGRIELEDLEQRLEVAMRAQTLEELDGALRMVEATDRRTHPLRLELNNFFFVQAIAGPERSRVVSGIEVAQKIEAAAVNGETPVDRVELIRVTVQKP